jgi:hypothetical protein
VSNSTRQEKEIMALAPQSRETRATTLRIPRPVYDQAKRLVNSEKASTATHLSLNDFFVTAIQAYVLLHERRQIDAAFALMGEDADYRKETMLLSEEFEQSDWDSLGRIEDHHEEPSRAASATR